MRFAIAFTVLFAWTTFSRADQPAPNTLAPDSISNGWILLFDGKTTFGWNVTGDAKVEDGELVLGGENGGTAETTCRFGHGILKFDYEQAAQHSDAPFSVFFFRRYNRFQEHSPTTGSLTIEVGDTLRPGTRSGSIAVADNPSGLSSIKFEVGKGRQIRLHNIKFSPADLGLIFNGKDLTGWHPYTGPDAKSKFSVTPEGTLHIENGKGDLQTDKQWSDFLLQIECRTNAPALNSGVFFRCQPNKYQQGYEAQIQNSFSPKKDFKEYTIERFDPQTHKLIAKDKVKYDSYDYGTGAIYRRIPARFKAANDKEWFTMTVLAEGRHMGVWVNGIMVTDWTDNRPDNDNGRNGFKAGPGNISLQGHDPTTNLDFRNIRIVDLSKK